MTVVPSADNSRLTVTVSPTALPIDTSLQYQVSDATRDSDRYVWGTITISVQDVPDPVTGVTVTEFGDRLLKLSWAPGQFNNSPITGYQVTVTSAESDDVLSTATCTSSVNCALTTPGNGPANAVRLSVVAINAIGPSAPTALAGTIWSDIIPPPPTSLGSTPLDQGLRVFWAKPPDSGGSAIDQYVVTVGDAVRVVEVNPERPGRHLLLGQPDVARDGQWQRGRLRGERAQQRPELPRHLEPGDRRRHPGWPAGAGGTVGVGVGLADRRLDRERLVGRGVR